MDAYPRNHNTKSSEVVEELVQIVTAMNSQAQERHGGLTDAGWKLKIAIPCYIFIKQKT